ncbi:endocuticle structural glycoprotein SgAbd-2 [Dendroctonus ponderosae]|uniref:Uncharacterized protein n=1 Tax=Dendroctonus ponderosae TaxID=77166 RepID=A0AAR5PM54_DENPD|nr:endocuticle structural glycoprotein SgAbd-2 [Dendroctonus ponderosae]KAH1002797.1 hypothetical protein HUJ04_008851 [Dendroctonus ponderosae]KAH1008801.1 hypothetical protein HUJ05_009326 [Dendroctonus ponderosae]
MFKVAVFISLLAAASCSPVDATYIPSGQSDVGSGARSTFSPSLSGLNAGTDATPKPKPIAVLKSSLENTGDGTYSYNYESANGIVSEEAGDVRGDGTKAHGSYSFTLPDGQHVSVSYTADENGFVAQGSHIPDIPEAIQKALEANAAAEARGVFDDGQWHGEGLEESQYKEEIGSAVGAGSVISAKSAGQGYTY